MGLTPPPLSQLKPQPSHPHLVRVVTVSIVLSVSYLMSRRQGYRIVTPPTIAINAHAHAHLVSFHMWPKSYPQRLGGLEHELAIPAQHAIIKNGCRSGKILDMFPQKTVPEAGIRRCWINIFGERNSCHVFLFYCFVGGCLNAEGSTRGSGDRARFTRLGKNRTRRISRTGFQSVY